MSRNVHIALALALALVPAGAIAATPTVADYLNSLQALRAYQYAPEASRGKYFKAHETTLKTATLTIERATDYLKQLVAINDAVMQKYGRPILCNFDEELGPTVENLVHYYQKDLQTKEQKTEQDAHTQTLHTYIDHVVISELLDKFPCASN